MAKEIAEKTPETPTGSDTKPSEVIVQGLAGAVSTVCALAVTSASFMVGAACGVLVAVGILIAQGK